MKVLDMATREENKVKVIHIGKKKIGLYLFANDMTLYIENPKRST